MLWNNTVRVTHTVNFSKGNVCNLKFMVTHLNECLGAVGVRIGTQINRLRTFISNSAGSAGLPLLSARNRRSSVTSIHMHDFVDGQ